MKKPDLAAALSDAGGGTRRRPEPVIEAVKEQPKTAHAQSGREETVPIMGHFPEAVRNQLKILAIELGKRRTVQDLLAEAINDLFAKYDKPEIAPRKGQ
jgi:hypothetical protein